MIRIILLDDHALVRDGVSRLLDAQPDMEVIESFGESESAIRFAEKEQPDVAIIDIAMPSANGIDVTRLVRRACSDTQVLVLSMHSNPEYVHQALLAGALGYVVKESAGPVLVDAVRSVHAGRRFLCSELGYEALRRYLDSTEKRDPVALLSAREQEVLRHTVEGRTIAETAVSLGISPKSVETYRSRMMTKLSIDGMPALVKFAIRHGITSVE
jgi:DNA-binding NarL/FixJ family response regulator